jgi:hypothetical protein
MTILDDLDIVKVRMVADDTKPAQMQKDIYNIFKTYQSSATPESVLPHSNRRLFYRINVIQAQPSSYTAEGTANDPALGTTIASVTAPAGVYTINGSTMLSGTATVADTNNMGVYVGSNLVMTLPNADSTEVLFAIPPFTVTVPTGGAVVSIKTIGAGSGTAGYWAAFALSSVSQTNSPVWLCGSQGDAQQTTGLGPQGAMLQPGFNEEMIGTTEVWLVCTGPNPPLVSFISAYDRGCQ